MGNRSDLIAEFYRPDPETEDTVRVQRFAPGKPRGTPVDTITVSMREECIDCVHREGFCMMALETGNDAPCMVEDEDRDSGSGRMFSWGE